MQRQRHRGKPSAARFDAGTPPLAGIESPGAVLGARNRFLEKVAGGSSLAEVFQSAVAFVEELTPAVAVVLHLVDRANARLSSGVSGRLPASLVRAMEEIPLEGPERDFAGSLERVVAELGRERGFETHERLPVVSSHGEVVALLTAFATKADPLAKAREEILRATRVLGIGVSRLRPTTEADGSGHFYALAARGAKDGLWHWDRERDELVVSPRWCALLGIPETKSPKSLAEWLALVHPEERVRVRGELLATVESGTAIFESKHRMVHSDGRHLWVLARGEASSARVAGSLTDVTQQTLAEERLRHDASHDDLTGLPNRSMLMDHLRRLLERARRSRKTFHFAVLFLDLDRFKRINDSLGHLAGDELLVAIGRRLRECVRPGDTVARLGGDEFALVLDHLGEVKEATRVAERVQQVLRQPFQLQGIEVFVTTSIGIAVGARSYQRPADVLRDADTAMYRAKAAGRARHEIFDRAMNASALEQLQLEAELRGAMERHEFRLLYLPVVTLQDRAVRGFEALARWRHPVQGLVPPSAFLPAAEETGIIVELGFWVLREACRQASRWRTPGSARSFSIHVNLSDKQLFHPELPRRIEAVLAETGLPPGELVLDVSESVIMQKAEASVTTLGLLKSLGLRIHLDDFGTGYSSLGYLHRFEIDTLKIDRSFVRHLRAGGDNWIAVRTILGLAESLGMSSIAEGVETEEQLEELLSLGCTLGQGNLFHPPLSPEQAEDLLR